MDSKKRIIGVVENLFYWGIIIGFFVMLSKASVDMKTLFEVINSGNYLWVGVAVAIEFINLVLLGIIFKISFSLANVDISLIRTMKNVLMMLALGIVTPLGSTGSSAFIIKRFKRKFNVPSVNSFLAVIFELIIVNFSFLVFSSIGVAFLIYNDSLNNQEVLAFLLEGILLGGLLLFVFLVLGMPVFLMKATDFVSYRFRALFRRSFRTSDERLASAIARIHHLVKRSLKQWVLFIKALGLAMVYYSLYVAILFSLAEAFHIEVSPLKLVTLFIIIMVVTIVSPSPQGIGFAEAFAQIASQSLGIDSGDSFVLIMSYRMITLWLPVLIGFSIVQLDHLLEQRQTKPDSTTIDTD